VAEAVPQSTAQARSGAGAYLSLKKGIQSAGASESARVIPSWLLTTSYSSRPLLRSPLVLI
jgi:hypothetical protein